MIEGGEMGIIFVVFKRSCKSSEWEGYGNGEGLC